jgi:hypothetical protein
MGYLSAGVRQLPYSDAIVAQELKRRAVTHDILSPVTARAYNSRSTLDIRVCV